MKTVLRFLFLAVLTSSWMIVSAVDYHFQEGFDGSIPDGWSSTNVYAGSSSSNDSLPGEKAIKMKATYSDVITKSVVGAGVLTYYMRPNITYTDGVLTVYMSTDGGVNWIEIDKILSSDYSVAETYERQTVDINNTGTVIIKFEAEGGTGTVELFMLDDIELTKLPPAVDDAKLSELTLGGVSVPGFSAGTFEYAVTIDFTTVIPVIDGTPNSDLATAVLTDLTDLQGTEAERTAKVVVTAEDLTTKQEYSIVVTVSDYHIETGFGSATVDSMGSVWTGWEDDATYITSSVKGPGNNGIFDGTSALKFMNKNEGDTPYIKSPAYVKVKNMSFWLFVEAPRAGAPCEIKIETITDGVSTELATIAESELATDAWTEFTYDLNIAKSTNILFTAKITGDWDGDMSTATRIWMDDLKITADAELGTGVNYLNKVNSNLSVYPNPVSNTLNIAVKDQIIKQVSLVNIAGSIVYSSNSQLSSIDMNLMVNGIYFLKVETETEIITKKVLKN